MKFVIVYSSRYGNGKKCVDCVDGALKARGHDVQVLNAPQSDPAQIPPADMYIFSGAAEAFGLAKGIKEYMKNIPELEGKKYALINTHGMKNARALPKMEKLLSRKKMVKVAEIHFQVGKEANTGNGLPAGFDAQLVQWVAGFT